jgi:prolyl-tRNA synthetase
MLIPTVKEVPNDAEIISHQLMIRAGLMRKLASGTYTYLPAGWRVLLKVMNIVRSEMNKAGAQEILMPAVQPMELWQKTGRDVDYGPTMAKFKDRHERWNVLAPTAEEVVTYIVAGELNSYKQMPFNIYQISFKFRDEFRPRFGVLRSREFIMKDSYSFHANFECLDKTYKVMYETYKRIFARAGVPYVIVEAESGEMGGTGSHQFTVPCENGEDVIVYSEDSSYAANIEKAAVDPLPKATPDANTPAIEEVATPDIKTIEQLCEFFKCRASSFIKTLIYTVGVENPKVIAAVVGGNYEINPEKLTQVFGGQHVELASDEIVAKATGAPVGFAGPIGLASKVDSIIIDHSIAAMKVGIAGANKADCHLKNVVPGRDFALEGANVKIADIRNAVEGDTYNGKRLLFKRGIEVGQVFKLGTKYSAKIGANFLDENGQSQPAIMGCYGIGINRIMASAIETGNDKDGIIWPISIAPFEVIITPVSEEDEIKQAAEDIYKKLNGLGVEVLLDDRDARGGVKFKDADLLGIPVRITIGKKTLAEGKVELKIRSESETKKIDLAIAADEVAKLVKDMKAKLDVEA